MVCDVRLLLTPFDPARELTAFSSAHPEAGGIASFLGQVRSSGGDTGMVEALELQHYEPLTLPAMQKLAAQAVDRWQLDGAQALHRSGLMIPGEPIVLVATAARHRRAAFAAAEYIMDHLKSDSWFWKREQIDGVWRWVEPREQDHDDIARWR